MVARTERAGENREILADELLLEIDGVGRHDGPLAVLAGPHERRHQIGERLADAGAGLEQADAAVVVEVRHVGRHVALAGAVLEAPEGAGHGAPRREQRRHVDRIDPRGGARSRALHHHVALGDVVVDDRESHAAVVQPRGDGEIRARRLEDAARVVVEQQLAPHRDPGEREHRVHGPARDHARLDDQPVRVRARHERHLAAVRRRDLRPHEVPHRGRQPLHAHVATVTS